MYGNKGLILCGIVVHVVLAARFQNLFCVSAGFMLLTFAADKLVEGASAMAIKFGVTPMLIGLTIVAFGTSLPELVISCQASLDNNPDIAVGNVVGSNIVNAALILGLAAIIQPLSCTRGVIRRDVPIMIGTAGLVWYIGQDLVISRYESAVLFTLFIAYNIAAYFWAKSDAAAEKAGQPAAQEASSGEDVCENTPESRESATTLQVEQSPSLITSPSQGQTATESSADTGADAANIAGVAGAASATGAIDATGVAGAASSATGAVDATGAAGAASSATGAVDATGAASAADTGAVPSPVCAISGLDVSDPAAGTLAEIIKKPTTLLYDCTWVVLGLIGLATGAKLLLYGAIAIAKNLDISNEIIGLTLVAVGTSLPELATAVVGAWRGQSDIIIGTIVGSNIFNILGILGVAGMILPLQVTTSMQGMSVPVMVVVSLGCLPIMRTGMRIIRLEGLILVTAYLVYLYMLFQTT